MNVIMNTWVEKEKRKKSPETAPAYEFDTKDTWLPINNERKTKRHSHAARATLNKTLRGLRK